MSTVGCFSNYLENKVLAEEFNSVPLYLALTTTASSDASAGTEATVMTQYARKPITFTTPVGGAISNTAIVDYGVVAGSGATIVGWAIFDAATGGNMLVYGDFDPVQTVSVNNNIVVPANTINISLD
jgi:hypothetical protein